jgi:hypothetical protein
MEMEDEQDAMDGVGLSDPEVLSDLNEWRLDFDDSESDLDDESNEDDDGNEPYRAERSSLGADATDEESLGDVKEDALAELSLHRLWQPQPQAYAFLDYGMSFISQCTAPAGIVGGVPSVPSSTQDVVVAKEEWVVEMVVQAMLGFQNDLFRADASRCSEVNSR